MSLKKNAVVFGLSLAMISATSLPMSRTSNAAVGLAIGNIPLAIAGGALLAIGLGTGLIGVPAVSSPYDDGKKTTIVAASAVFVGVIGVVLLDGDTPGVHFERLTPAQADLVGLSGQEQAAYSRNLTKLNRISDEVALHLVNSGKVSAEASEAIWSSYRDSLDPAAFSALGKVMAYNLKASHK